MMRRINSYLIAGLVASFVITPSVNATLIILDDSFDPSPITKASLERDDTGWHQASTASWVNGTGNGWMYNTTNSGGNTSDGAVARIIHLGGLGLGSEDRLTVDLKFVSWDGTTGDNLYIHLWGLEDVSSTAASNIANLGAQDGNMWANAVDNGFNVTNLGDGTTFSDSSQANAGSAAIQLLNQDSGTANFGDAIDYSANFDSVGTLADYDYLVVGIGRNPAVGTGNGSSFYDFTLTATSIPEPSSLALLFVGGALVLGLRRRHVAA